MKYKKIAILLGAVIFFFIISELVNYLSDPASSSSTLINKYFINQSIFQAQNGKLDDSFKNLYSASHVNVFGEFDPYRKLLPSYFNDRVVLNDNPQLEDQMLNYLSNLKESDLTKSEDQGLGKIFYDMGLIAYKSDRSDLTPYYFKKAIYNNPEFASFHVELINYYLVNNLNSEVKKQFDYCLNFKGAEAMCSDYKKASIDTGISREVGFLSDEIYKYYSN